MASGDDPAPEADPPLPPALPSGSPTVPVAEVLQRLSTQPRPLNLNAEHEKRLTEALVKEAETASDQAGDDRELRRWIAIGTAIAVGLQLGATNAIFVVYGAANAWVIPGGTVSAWLGATVVQIIALAVVIVRSLFPPKNT